MAKNGSDGDAQYLNQDLMNWVSRIDLGNAVAEQDPLLESARVDTSAFGDLLNDRVDLVPGTKGSGKSALYRIFVEFLPDFMLKQRKAVIAHGVNRPGDNVFHVFKDEFEELTEDEFVDFWCIYVVSLVNEQFLKNDRYRDYLATCSKEVEEFRRACSQARIPDVKAGKSLREVLAWTLSALKVFRPRLKYTPPGDVGDFEFPLFPEAAPSARSSGAVELPKYMSELRDNLERLLAACGLTI